MSIRQVLLPPRFSRALHENPNTENLAISAWEDVAVSVQELSAALRKQLEDPVDRADKPYMARELITTAVETIEILGSALLRFRNPEHRQFHFASNDELTTLFAAIAQEIPEDEALDFLRLPRPSHDDPKLAAALQHIGKRAQDFLIDFAGYWQANIQSVRWFRHYPACLAWNEPPIIDTSNNPELTRIQAEIKERLPHLLEVIVHPDERGFDYEPLEPTAGRLAAGITRVAIQVLYMISGNQVLEPRSTDPSHRLPKVFPAFTRELPAEQLDALQRWGGYFLVP
jgi:hypothetical protein